MRKAHVWLGLLDEDGREVRGGGYARVMAELASDGKVAKLAKDQVVFPQATTDWGRAPYFAIYSTHTALHPLVTGQLSASVFIQAGNTATFNGLRATFIDGLDAVFGEQLPDSLVEVDTRMNELQRRKLQGIGARAAAAFGASKEEE